jgi:pimeloyl-ACP methyl ester carboxylesterase
MADSGIQSLTINARRLECRRWGGIPAERPAIVLLHEGLGSVALWRSFPEQLAARTGWCVFAWSRAGYGGSDPAELPRPLDYMEREAVDVLPQVLDAIGFRRGVILGHSDGASIAAIHAGTFADPRVRGVVLIAPHFFTEPMGLAGIAEARAHYENGGLRDRLVRHHADADNAFWGWCGAWLDPRFQPWNIERFIGAIRSPILAIQGREDQYGTLRQMDALRQGACAPLDVRIVENCGHSPHLEQPEQTLAIVSEFVARVVPGRGGGDGGGFEPLSDQLASGGHF